MFDIKLLRRVGLLTLFFFIWFSISADFSFAQEGDDLLKARKMYQQGDYDRAISLLTDFISKLKAIAAQKKNVAEAFYLLAKVYYTVGEDTKVENNLRKVFETYPNFSKEESDLEFKDRVEKIRKKVKAEVKVEVKEKKEEKKVLPKPAKKKRKKFPVLLVLGGLTVVGLLVYFLLIKKSETKEEQYDIRGTWNLNLSGDFSGILTITFFGGLNSGSFTDLDGDSGTYTVSGKNVTFIYNVFVYPWVFNGIFVNKTFMQGNWTYDIYSGSWSGGMTSAKKINKNTFSTEFKKPFPRKIESIKK